VAPLSTITIFIESISLIEFIEEPTPSQYAKHVDQELAITTLNSCEGATPNDT
jgi:hypothetical protein